MANPASFAVHRPRVVLLATLMLLIYGVLSYQGLPRQENPSLQDRVATVVTYLPGAEPEKVEQLVTEVLEDAVAEVDDVETMVSNSSHGASWLLVEVDRDADAPQRLQEVRDRVQEARARFPDGTSEPEIDSRTLRTNTVVLALVGEGLPLPALRKQARELKRDLEHLADVRRVELVGLPAEEIEVGVDLQRLSQRGLPLTRVIDALAERNVRLPSGELELGETRSGIQTTGAFDAANEMANVYLGAGPDGLPIRLGEVASVGRRLAEPDALVHFQGRRAVALGVEMRPGRNAIALGERIRAFLAEREGRLPEGMRVHVVADEPTYVRQRLGLLMGSLLIGLGLVVSLSLVGMGWRSGAVVSLTIPLALTVAMALQGALNVPLHQISIAALVIAIGIVVDESIVVTDNIQRHLDRGRPPKQAAIDGLGEIHLAVLAGAATTVAAFIPLMIMGGDIGDFIRSIPVVVTLMLVGSVVVAHFVTPLLAVWMQRVAPGRGGGGFWSRLPLEARYGRLVRGIVARPRRVLAGFAAAVGGAVVLVATVLWPPVFFPDADRHQFLIRVVLHDSAPLEETRAVMAAIEARLEGDPDLADWTTFTGEDAPKFYYNEFKGNRSENRGQIVINTQRHVDFHRTRAVASRIEADLKAHVPGALIRARPLRQGYVGNDDVEIYLTGDNLDVLRVLASRIREMVGAEAGVRAVWDSFHYDPITLQAQVDGARANLLGVSHRDVATTLRTAVDGVVATALREEDDEIDIRVRLVESQRRDTQDLAALPIFSPATGSAVPLSHVAALEPGFTRRAILRFDRKREAAIGADLEPGVPVLEAATRIERAVRAGIDLPPGYALHFFGQGKEATESFLRLVQSAVVAVFLIYIVLVVRFQSLSQPGLILLAIPMSAVGASVGLAATGNAISFMAFLGVIALTGIAVNDSIVLVDTINRLRREDVPLEEAVAAGATTRLRAVAMTSITTMGGLLPLSVGGGAFWAPFGFAMIFGLMASTLLTLGVQPAAYLTLERIRLRRRA